MLVLVVMVMGMVIVIYADRGLLVHLHVKSVYFIREFPEVVVDVIIRTDNSMQRAASVIVIAPE